MINFREMTKRFLMGEGKREPSLKGYIQALNEILDKFKPKTTRDNHRLSIAQQHLREIRKMARRLEEKVELLEEQIKILEEGNSINEKQKTSK